MMEQIEKFNVKFINNGKSIGITYEDGDKEGRFIRFDLELIRTLKLSNDFIYSGAWGVNYKLMFSSSKELVLCLSRAKFKHYVALPISIIKNLIINGLSNLHINEEYANTIYNSLKLLIINCIPSCRDSMDKNNYMMYLKKQLSVLSNLPMKDLTRTVIDNFIPYYLYKLVKGEYLCRGSVDGFYTDESDRIRTIVSGKRMYTMDMQLFELALCYCVTYRGLDVVNLNEVSFREITFYKNMTYTCDDIIFDRLLSTKCNSNAIKIVSDYVSISDIIIDFNNNKYRKDMYNVRHNRIA